MVVLFDLFISIQDWRLWFSFALPLLAPFAPEPPQVPQVLSVPVSVPHRHALQGRETARSRFRRRLPRGDLED